MLYSNSKHCKSDIKIMKIIVKIVHKKVVKPALLTVEIAGVTPEVPAAEWIGKVPVNSRLWI